MKKGDPRYTTEDKNNFRSRNRQSIIPCLCNGSRYDGRGLKHPITPSSTPYNRKKTSRQNTRNHIAVNSPTPPKPSPYPPPDPSQPWHYATPPGPPDVPAFERQYLYRKCSAGVCPTRRASRTNCCTGRIGMGTYAPRHGPYVCTPVSTLHGIDGWRNGGMRRETDLSLLGNRNFLLAHLGCSRGA